MDSEWDQVLASLLVRENKGPPSCLSQGQGIGGPNISQQSVAPPRGGELEPFASSNDRHTCIPLAHRIQRVWLKEKLWRGLLKNGVAWSSPLAVWTEIFAPDLRIFDAPTLVLNRGEIAIIPALRCCDNYLVGICINDKIGVMRHHDDLPTLFSGPEMRDKLFENRAWIEIFLGLIDEERSEVVRIDGKIQQLSLISVPGLSELISAGSLPNSALLRVQLWLLAVWTLGRELQHARLILRRQSRGHIMEREHLNGPP